jgi:hypothetical protein
MIDKTTFVNGAIFSKGKGERGKRERGKVK